MQNHAQHRARGDRCCAPDPERLISQTPLAEEVAWASMACGGTMDVCTTEQTRRRAGRYPCSRFAKESCALDTRYRPHRPLAARDRHVLDAPPAARPALRLLQCHTFMKTFPSRAPHGGPTDTNVAARCSIRNSAAAAGALRLGMAWTPFAQPRSPVASGTCPKCADARPTRSPYTESNGMRWFSCSFCQNIWMEMRPAQST